MRRKVSIVCCCVALIVLLGGVTMSAEKGEQKKMLTRQEIRQMIKDLDTLPQDQRKAKIQEFYEKVGKPMREKLTKAQYQPGKVDEQTKEFVFKKTPNRELKVYVRFPDDWKAADRRPAIIFWHGGGFTQGNAGQFYEQAKFFNARGAVVALPEYRIRDLDQTMPHNAIEDAVSAMRWFRGRAEQFGADPDCIVVGGGSAGGCIASVLGTLDAGKFAAMGYVGAEDDRSISIRPAAMLLYNPFVDFFEPLNARHIEEECLMSGYDPVDLFDAYHLISAIEHVNENTSPNIIMFGTKDAFYPQSIRWIVKCREKGVKIHDYVYKGEVHSWYNNSPHLEYTSENVDKFLVEIGFLQKEPKVELPHRVINPNRKEIQEKKYEKKTDWDEQERFQKYVKEHKITIIPFKHFEKK